MLELLDWGKRPQPDPTETGTGLGALGGAEPAAALGELTARLEDEGGADALARIQDAGEAHVAALLARCFTSAAGTLAARESTWRSLADFQTRLARALCTAAGAQPGAQAAARALYALRTLAKIYLIHYESVPGRVWRVAYALHAAAERAGCADAPVHARADRHATSTAGQELLRLLMLRVSAPDMMAPEQIEIADRALEQLGPELTLRPPGVADNPFCYEPDGEFPPRRAKGRPPSATARYFGPGMGYGSLERIARELAGAKGPAYQPFGRDLGPRVQQAAVQHLLLFWRVDSPYAPPEHAAASGRLQVVHGYAALWQFLSQAGAGATELALADYAAAPQPEETWTLRAAGGSELGAEVPPASRAWAKCGAVLGLAQDGGARWVGLIRRMHSRPDGGLQADVAVLSRAPRVLALREVLEKYEDSVYTNASSRQFAAGSVNAVILADGADAAQPPNLVLPADQWKPGRVYEATGDGAKRYLRALKAVRQGEDFVRATFEWVTPPEPTIPVAVPGPGLSLDPG